MIGVGPELISSLHIHKLRAYEHKLVAFPTATFRGKRDFNAHRLLRAIDENILLSKLQKEQQASETDLYLDDRRLRETYKDYPWLLRNAQQVLESCQVELPEEPALNLQTYTGSKKKDVKLLKKLCYDGLTYRYPQADFKVRERIEKDCNSLSKRTLCPIS